MRIAGQEFLLFCLSVIGWIWFFKSGLESAYGGILREIDYFSVC
jgi:hypothetical protein